MAGIWACFLVWPTEPSGSPFLSLSPVGCLLVATCQQLVAVAAPDRAIDWIAEAGRSCPKRRLPRTPYLIGVRPGMKVMHTTQAKSKQARNGHHNAANKPAMNPLHQKDI